MTLRICHAVFAGMITHVQSLYPEEGCGFLSGQGNVACRYFPVPNLAAASNRFHMHPQAQIDALYAIAAAGEELLAIYHSHPHGPASLSPTDLAELPDGRVPHIVISLQKPEQPKLRLFVLDQMRIHEEFWHLV